MAKSVCKIIETDADITRGVRALKRACPAARRMHAVVGSPPLRRQTAGFEGLARIIVGQQLSVASAAAIWGRCQARLQPFTPEKVTRTRETTLKSLGLSAAKIRTLRATSKAITQGALQLDDLSLNDDDLFAQLTDVTGIGPWTADIYLMFSVGRPDAFAPGDLALQIGAQYAFELDERPTPQQLVDLTQNWRPWRAVGARMLWAYYAAVKSQKSSAVPI